MADPITPGDIATPPVAEPAEPKTPPAEPPAPTGSEPDTNPGGEPAMVPSSRLHEETEKRRKAEERVAELEATPPPPPSQNDDIELEPDTEKLLESFVKKRGLVSQDELAAERNKIQVQQDVSDLTANPPNVGIPYDNKAVMDFAKENNLPITSKAALKAAYREMNYDKIVEAERQRAIDDFKKSGSSGAEQPSSPGAVPPAEQEIDSKLSAKDRTRERIRLAREKLSV